MIFYDQEYITICSSDPFISYQQSKEKNLYLMRLLFISTNFIESINDTLEESFGFSNINMLIILLRLGIFKRKKKKIYESNFLNLKENT